MVAGEGTELRGGEGSGAEDMVHMAGCIGEETEYFVQGGVRVLRLGSRRLGLGKFLVQSGSPSFYHPLEVKETLFIWVPPIRFTHISACPAFIGV
jgi:hypothetical protein